MFVASCSGHSLVEDMLKIWLTVGGKFHFWLANNWTDRPWEHLALCHPALYPGIPKCSSCLQGRVRYFWGDF